MTTAPPPPPPRLLPPAAAIGLAAGIAVLAAALALPPPAGLSEAGWQTLGLAVAMAIWWSTEPVPMAVTALMPLIVLPLTGAIDLGAVAAPYASPLVFLFLGGFLLAGGIERWGLHRRLAHWVMARVGTEPRRLVLGLMAATAFLSLWISNTATVVLMLPVAASVVAAMEQGRGRDEHTRRFARALLLGVAYAASIGGLGTLIGTPPNALLAGYLLERHQIDLSFAAWSAFAMPVVVVLLPLTWLLLTRVTCPVPRALAAAAQAEPTARAAASLGAMQPAEKRVAAVFLVAALLWATRPLLNDVPGLAGLSDSGIALACAAALFLIPAGAGERRFLLTWREARDVPWQVLILFGGGLSLAAAMDSSGLAEWIGQGLAGLGGLPPLLFLALLVTTVVLLSELASNTAVTAALLPVAASVAAGAGMDVLTVSAAVAMAASAGFMLPVATPPNALVFASGHLTVADMVRSGAVIDLVSIGLVSLTAWLLVPLLGPG